MDAIPARPVVPLPPPARGRERPAAEFTLADRVADPRVPDPAGARDPDPAADACAAVGAVL